MIKTISIKNFKSINKLVNHNGLFTCFKSNTHSIVANYNGKNSTNRKLKASKSIF